MSRSLPAFPPPPSRARSRKGASVSPKTRAKVEDAARTLGYAPSLIARSLATNRTKLIGLVANNFQNPVFLDVFDLYTRALQARGFRPLLVNLSDVVDPSESARLLKQYQRRWRHRRDLDLAAGVSRHVSRRGPARSSMLSGARRGGRRCMSSGSTISRRAGLAAQTLLGARLSPPRLSRRAADGDLDAGSRRRLPQGAGRGGRRPAAARLCARLFLRRGPRGHRRAAATTAGWRRSSAATISSAWARWTARAPRVGRCPRTSASSASTTWRWRAGRPTT